MWNLIKTSAANWMGHKDARLGAALAYYSIFSLGPITVIAMAVAGLFFGRDAVQAEVAAAMKGLLGDNGAQAVQTMLAGASKPSEGLLATLAVRLYGFLRLMAAARRSSSSDFTLGLFGFERSGSPLSHSSFRAIAFRLAARPVWIDLSAGLFVLRLSRNELAARPRSRSDSLDMMTHQSSSVELF